MARETTFNLPAGKVLTVTAPAHSRGSVFRVMEGGAGTDYFVSVDEAAPLTIGPFTADRKYEVVTEVGASLTGVISQPDLSLLLLPDGLTIVPCDGAPDDGTAASLTTTLTGSDNDLVFTAVAVGETGNLLSVQYIDPGANNQALSIQIIGGYIRISLATGVAGAITTTSGDIAALDFGGVVTVDDSGSDDGTGIVTAMAKTYFSGGEDATGQGKANTGSLAIDYTTPDLYVNAGTLALPDWKKFTRAS